MLQIDSQPGLRFPIKKVLANASLLRSRSVRQLVPLQRFSYSMAPPSPSPTVSRARWAATLAGSLNGRTPELPPCVESNADAAVPDPAVGCVGRINPIRPPKPVWKEGFQQDHATKEVHVHHVLVRLQGSAVLRLSWGCNRQQPALPQSTSPGRGL